MGIPEAKVRCTHLIGFVPDGINLATTEATINAFPKGIMLVAACGKTGTSWLVYADAPTTDERLLAVHKACVKGSVTTAPLEASAVLRCSSTVPADVAVDTHVMVARRLLQSMTRVSANAPAPIHLHYGRVGAEYHYCASRQRS